MYSFLELGIKAQVRVRKYKFLATGLTHVLTDFQAYCGLTGWFGESNRKVSDFLLMA